MFLLIFGVFEKNSSSLVYSLAIITLIIALGIIINFPQDQKINLFNNSYTIDQLSIFMKVVIIISGIFVLVSSYDYARLEKISNIEYSVLILCSILGMLVMIGSYDLIVFYIGLELQSLSLYVLVAFNRHKIQSI